MGSWDNQCKSVALDIKEASKLIQNLWKSSKEILNDCNMELMDCLEEATPSELRVEEVEKC
jgi:hypothetical protein